MKDLLNKMNEDFCKIIVKANSHDAFLEEQSGELNPDLPTCKECGNEDYWEDISYYNYLGDKVYMLKCEGEDCGEEIYL